MTPKFTKEDFTLPEVFWKVFPRCWNCGEKLSSCIICGEPFGSEVDTKVACGGPKGHICRDCRDDLDNGEAK